MAHPVAGSRAVVMLAMRFVAEQCAAHWPGLELLNPRAIVEMLKATMPGKPEGRDAQVARINQRYAGRRGALNLATALNRKRIHATAKIMPPNLTLSN
jgi:hypothetical protein